MKGEYKMAWKEELRAVIEGKWSIGDIFTLNDIYELEEYFLKLYPENNNVKDKLRQTLQYLRDDGILDFIDNNGRYKRIL